ncbi:cytochrome P450 [Myxococcus sp. K38C18041901]|uniref:cytochrome P450 n=1 Tax=Myxococcus guangdongensis TaxID=2906760 RepID=UPI0020A77402|nr:cytochrome P450 [Myxococcus guangdongensis]MCP3063750.1 cytochrome P450 [Myxococcus guangdongensis]
MSTRLNFLSREFLENPYPHLATLRQQGPVVQVEPGGMWAVTRHDEAQFVLKSPQLFSSEGLRMAFQPEWLGRLNPTTRSLPFLDPPQHGRLRALISRAFAPATLERLEPRIRATARRHLDDMMEKRKVDFVGTLATAIPADTIEGMLGLDDSTQTHFKQWATDIIAISGVRPEDTEQMARSRAALDAVETYSQTVLDDRRREPREDMVSDLLRARVDGESLTQQELVGFLITLLIAGLETTVNLLSHGARVFAMRPELLPRLRQTPSLIPRFIEETLRYEPPISATLRTCTQDVTLAGVTLPRGAMVLVSLASVSRDEKHVPDGERFDLDRKPQPHLSLGHGPHFCIGAWLARLEARVALEEFVARVDRVEVRTERIEWNPSLNVRGPLSLPVELFPT